MRELGNKIKPKMHIYDKNGPKMRNYIVGVIFLVLLMLLFLL